MKKISRIIELIQKNSFAVIFIVAIIFVGFTIFSKIFLSKTAYLYAKVRVGQGYWWVGARPAYWFLPALKKGEVERSLSGNPLAQIISVRYYSSGSIYDVYLTVKLKTSFNKRTKKYYYKRWQVAVGTPIDFEFPEIQVSGTVINISEKPFNEKYTEKIVHLISLGGYSVSNPYYYENIKVGDKYFDGEDTIFEILDKQLRKNVWTVTDDQAFVHERDVYSVQDIVVKAKIKVKQVGNQLFFAEDQVVSFGNNIRISTPNYGYNFTVIKIE